MFYKAFIERFPFVKKGFTSDDCQNFSDIAIKVDENNATRVYLCYLMFLRHSSF